MENNKTNKSDKEVKKMKNTLNNKKVSIILAHYNQPMYVKQAFYSISNEKLNNNKISVRY